MLRLSDQMVQEHKDHREQQTMVLLQLAREDPCVCTRTRSQPNLVITASAWREHHHTDNTDCASKSSMRAQARRSRSLACCRNDSVALCLSSLRSATPM